MENDWAKIDNAQFSNASDFGNLETESSILPDNTPHSIGESITYQLEKERNISQGQEQDITNPNNLESKLSESLQELLETNSSRKESLRQSGRT